MKPYFLLFFVLLLGYFPIASFMAGVKNDILTGYLPVRFFMSESIADGFMPWWNPYVNFGIPQYADMSSSFWSPITWLIAGTAGYNVYTITIELLCYLFIGAWGMYRCGAVFGWTKEVKLMAAITFLFTGFMVGHLQHLNWIAGAGFLPLCFWSYHELLRQFSLKKLLRTVFFFYLLLSAAHPGIIIGSFYFFGLYSIYSFFQIAKVSNQYPQTTKQFLRSIFLFISLLLLVSVAMIYSYTEILPYITRGEKLTDQMLPKNGNTIQSWISFIFPLSTVKNDVFFDNDISLRNNYIGILFLLFTMLSLRFKQSRFYLLTGLFFLLLSSTNPIQQFISKILPLIGYVRLNGEFRLFALFAFIIAAGNYFQNAIQTNVQNKFFNRLSLLIALFILLIVIGAGYQIVHTKESIFYHSIQWKAFTFADFFKPLVDQLHFYDTLFIQGIIQFILLGFIRSYFLQKKLKALLTIVIIDLCLATLLQLPFTGAGVKSTAELQSILNQSPKGIPIPDLHPLSANNPGMAGVKDVLGSWSFYNKEPGTLIPAAYPIRFKTESLIFQPTVLYSISNQAFISYHSAYMDSVEQGIINSPIQLTAFSPSHLHTSFKAFKTGELVLLYQIYPHWTYRINGKEINTTPNQAGFVSIPINQTGAIEADFQFNPTPIKVLGIISIISLLLIGVGTIMLPDKKIVELIGEPADPLTKEFAGLK